MLRFKKIILITCLILLGDLDPNHAASSHWSLKGQHANSGQVKDTCCFPEQIEGTIFSPLTRSHSNFSIDYTQGRVLISPYYENPLVQSYVVFDLKSKLAYRFENDGSCRSSPFSAPFPTPIAYSRCAPRHDVTELEPGFLGSSGHLAFRKFEIKDGFHRVTLTVLNERENCFPLSTDTLMSYPPIRFNHQYLNLRPGLQDASRMTPDVDACQ